LPEIIQSSQDYNQKYKEDLQYNNYKRKNEEFSYLKNNY
jgi:hypothetical protein